MKAESGIKPKLFNFDKVGENAVISLFDNVKEVETQEDEVGIIFEYDYYSVEVPYRDGLELDVEYNFEKWLSLAIAKERLLPTPDLEERLQMAEDTLLFLLMGGM